MRNLKSRLIAVGVYALAIAAAFMAAAVPAQAAGVQADIVAQIHGRFTGTNDLGSPVFPIDLRAQTTVAPGTGSGYADLVFADERTIAASSTENLDLAGALTSPLGQTLTFVKVKTIMIVASSANTNNVVVGGAGSNTFIGPFADATDKIAVPPGGILLLTHPGAGWTVTASTGDILLVGNSGSGSGVTYKVVLIGTSA